MKSISSRTLSCHKGQEQKLHPALLLRILPPLKLVRQPYIWKVLTGNRKMGQSWAQKGCLQPKKLRETVGMAKGQETCWVPAPSCTCPWEQRDAGINLSSFCLRPDFKAIT